jgi:hypothetical protein
MTDPYDPDLSDPAVLRAVLESKDPGKPMLVAFPSIRRVCLALLDRVEAGLAAAVSAAEREEHCVFCGGHDYSGQGGPDGQLSRDKCPVYAPKLLEQLRTSLAAVTKERDYFRDRATWLQTKLNNKG